MKTLILILLIIQVSAVNADWRVNRDESIMDDTKSITLIKPANETIPATIGRSEPALIIRCRENKTDVFIGWGVYLGIDETQSTIRIDDRDPVTSTWNLSTNYQSAFHRQPIPFLRQLNTAQRLAARITPYGANPATVTFTLDGLSELLPEVAETCNWSLNG